MLGGVYTDILSDKDSICLSYFEPLRFLIFRGLRRKAAEKRPPGRHGRRWENNFKINLKKYCQGCELDSSGSGEGPVRGSCEHSNEPSGSIKVGGGDFWTSSTTVSF